MLRGTLVNPLTVDLKAKRAAKKQQPTPQQLTPLTHQQTLHLVPPLRAAAPEGPPPPRSWEYARGASCETAFVVSLYSVVFVGGESDGSSDSPSVSSNSFDSLRSRFRRGFSVKPTSSLMSSRNSML
jgi:hypothetical protein